MGMQGNRRRRDGLLFTPRVLELPVAGQLPLRDGEGDHFRHHTTTCSRVSSDARWVLGTVVGGGFYGC